MSKSELKQLLKEKLSLTSYSPGAAEIADDVSAAATEIADTGIYPREELQQAADELCAELTNYVIVKVFF